MGWLEYCTETSFWLSAHFQGAFAVRFGEGTKQVSEKALCLDWWTQWNFINWEGKRIGTSIRLKPVGGYSKLSAKSCLKISNWQEHMWSWWILWSLFFTSLVESSCPYNQKTHHTKTPFPPCKNSSKAHRNGSPHPGRSKRVGVTDWGNRCLEAALVGWAGIPCRERVHIHVYNILFMDPLYLRTYKSIYLIYIYIYYNIYMYY